MFPIASITLRRMREPAFFILVIVGILISYPFASLGTFNSDIAGQELFFGESPKESSIFLGTILFVLLCALISIFNAAADIPRDISSRMIAIFLSKPISRHSYIWGKFIGTVTIGWVCGACWLTFMLVARVNLPDAATFEPLTLDLALRQYACLLLIAPVSAISVGISCYFSDVIAMIVTCIYILLSFAATLFPVIIELMGHLVIGKVLLLPYYIFPNLLFYLSSYESPSSYAILAIYALATSTIFILLGRAKFDRGDIF